MPQTRSATEPTQHYSMIRSYLEGLNSESSHSLQESDAGAQWRAVWAAGSNRSDPDSPSTHPLALPVNIDMLLLKVAQARIQYI